MTGLETMTLGAQGPTISRLGMGCWALGGHGWGKVDVNDALRAVSCAADNGVTFFDTADAYGLGLSEELLAKALGKSRNDVVIATKGGVRWNSRREVWTDISPSYLRRAVEASLRRLHLEQIPLYYLHKPDGVTLVQDSVAALERLREDGKIGAIGLANFSTGQLTDALQVAPVSAVQVRFNLFDRSVCRELLGICTRHAITVVAWGALADGLLTGKFSAETRFPDDDHRSRMSEFEGEAFLNNLATVASLERLAASRGRKVSQLALRWVLDRAKVTCSLFGAKTDTQVMQNLGADGWNLTEEELATIDDLVC